MILSHCRHANRSRTVWTTFHRRGITSSVSVTSSPSFDSFGRTAARAALGRFDDDALARQMSGKGFARRSLARERVGRPRFCSRSLGRQFVLARRRLEVLQLQLHLLEQTGLALGSAAVKFAAQLLDLQLQVGHQGGLIRPRRLSGETRRALHADHSVGSQGRRGAKRWRCSRRPANHDPLRSPRQNVTRPTSVARSRADGANQCPRADSRAAPG